MARTPVPPSVVALVAEELSASKAGAALWGGRARLLDRGRGGGGAGDRGGVPCWWWTAPGYPRWRTRVQLLQQCLREAVLKGSIPVRQPAPQLVAAAWHPPLAEQCRRRLLASPSAALAGKPEWRPVRSAYAGSGVVPVCGAGAPRATDRLLKWQEIAAARGISIDERTLLALYPKRRD